VSRDRSTRLRNEIAERYGNATTAPGRATQSETQEPHAVDGDVDESVQPEALDGAEQQAAEQQAAEEQPAEKPLYTRPGPFAQFAAPESDED
jgi:hypothetical protein